MKVVWTCCVSGDVTMGDLHDLDCQGAEEPIIVGRVIVGDAPEGSS